LDLLEQERPRQVQFFFLAPRWPAPIVRSTFEAATWSSETGALIQQTITLLSEGIQGGRFFIVPDSYCKTCEYRVACRREHTPSWWRAHRAREPRTLTVRRALRVKDE
jgi:ATP-dependent helicase/nuclease subunit B